ncbi:L-seryl-tRNASec kinase [Hondaea fermentalgiana]|uniref:L-seryl-tRNASec kinase n=1 Tax=Hondaea fermentalgiana TaxID=2315210 RepID=A0A2R5GUG7_9STRA|nr:L-seryl-tRNASec kinase [Hondaea fermentalgiana]|eukprot:GBG34490.1 L-seryl-tRNASec kinase [Hondaea fermentalgiana]
MNSKQRPAVIAVTVGLPGAGKSSLCQRIENYARVSGHKDRVVLISFDDEEQSLSSECNNKETLTDFDTDIWHKARERALEKAKQALAATNDPIDESSKSIQVLLVDDNMYYQSMRVPFRQLAERVGAGYLEIAVDCELEEAMRRNALRESPHRVPADVLRRMAGRLEPPTPGRRSLHVKSDDDLETLFCAMRAASAEPEVNHEASRAAEAAASRASVNASATHQRELQLRRIVGEFIKKVPATSRRGAAALAAQVKSEIAVSDTFDVEAMAALLQRRYQEYLSFNPEL